MCYLLLPFLAFSLPLAMVGLFVMFFFVEVAIVSSIPLFTEIMPDARAVMMSGNVGAHALGRMVGASLGGTLYAATGSFPFLGATALVIGLVAAFMLWRFVHE